MLKTSYYGLVKQNGPWRKTALDRQHLAERDQLAMGGGIPAGGLKHAGHANWLLSVAYPDRSDGLSSPGQFSSYPSVKEMGVMPSQRTSVSFRQRARAVARGIGPVSGPAGVPIRVTPSQTPGAPGTVSMVGQPMIHQVQTPPVTREPIPTMGMPPSPMTPEQAVSVIGKRAREEETQRNVKSVKLNPPKIIKQGPSVYRPTETTEVSLPSPLAPPLPTSGITEISDIIFAPLPGGWPTQAAPVKEPVVEPRKQLLLLDAPSGQGELQLNEIAHQQSSQIETTVAGPSQTQMVRLPNVVTPRLPDSIIEPTLALPPPEGVSRKEKMSEIRKQQAGITKQQRMMTREERRRRFMLLNEKVKSAVKPDATAPTEVIGPVPSQPIDSGSYIDATCGIMQQNLNAIDTAVGLGQTIETTSTPAGVVNLIQSASTTDPGLAQAAALADAPAPTDFGLPSPTMKYIPSMTAEREQRKAAKKKKAEAKKQREVGREVTITDQGRKVRRLNKGVENTIQRPKPSPINTAVQNVRGMPALTPESRKSPNGTEWQVRWGTMKRWAKLGSEKYKKAVVRGDIKPFTPPTPSPTLTRKGKKRGQ